MQGVFSEKTSRFVVVFNIYHKDLDSDLGRKKPANISPVRDVEESSAVPQVGGKGHVRVEVVAGVEIGVQTPQKGTGYQVTRGHVGHVPQPTPVIVHQLHVI